MTTHDDAIRALTDDGKTYALPDGRTLRLTITPDDIDPFAEHDAYGRVAPVKPDRHTVYPATRPDGFDGNAEKLWSRSQYWWQPPTDAPRRDDPAFSALRALVCDVLNYGMCVVSVELLDGTDAYSRPIVRDVASLAGVEPMPSSEDLAGFVADLLSELGI